MRVGLITYGLDRPLTGISRYTLELILAMSQIAGVELVLLKAGELSPIVDNAIEQVSLPGCSRLPGLITLGQVVIPAITRRMRLDLVHDPTGITPLGFGAGVPVVSTVHDLIPISYPGNSSLLDTLIYKYWLPFQLPRIATVITVSEYSRADIMRHMRVPAERIHTINPGVRDLFQPKDIAESRAYVRTQYGIEHPYMLFLGNLTQRKNVDLALRSFARIRESFPELRFVLVGPSTFRQTPVGEMAQALGISESIILTGPVPDSALPYLLSAAEVLVFPSFYEGFGLPVLEAMSCGAPVITSKVTSLPEVAGDAAILIDPHSEDEMTDALRRVLSNAELRSKMRADGLQRAQSFTWEKTARSTVDVYQRTLNQHQSSRWA